MPPEVQAALDRREPIEAIKLLLLSRAGVKPGSAPAARRSAPARAPGLQRGPAPPPTPGTGQHGLSPGEVPRVRSTAWGWVMLALVAYLAWRLLAR